MILDFSNWGVAVGVFEDSEDFHHAIDELGYLGFSEIQIGTMATAQVAREIASSEANGLRSVPAAGLAVRLMSRTFAVSDDPTLVLAGTLAELSSRVPSKGLADLLSCRGIPDDEASDLENEVLRGQLLVIVNAGPRTPIANVVLKRVRRSSGQSCDRR